MRTPGFTPHKRIAEGETQIRGARRKAGCTVSKGAARAVAALRFGGKFAQSLNDPKARWARGRCYFEANTNDASGQSSPIAICNQEALPALGVGNPLPFHEALRDSISSPANRGHSTPSPGASCQASNGCSVVWERHPWSQNGQRMIRHISKDFTAAQNATVLGSVLPETVALASTLRIVLW